MKVCVKRLLVDNQVCRTLKDQCLCNFGNRTSFLDFLPVTLVLDDETDY
jgi:hypothetical protein